VSDRNDFTCWKFNGASIADFVRSLEDGVNRGHVIGCSTINDPMRGM
jgi:hypothetical protein